jgi:hypothetical protein
MFVFVLLICILPHFSVLIFFLLELFPYHIEFKFKFELELGNYGVIKTKMGSEFLIY